MAIILPLEFDFRIKPTDTKKQREWDTYFLKLAEVVAIKSCDLSTKVGCVIVGPDHEIRSTGYNGMPRGVEPDNVRLARPVKYLYTEHAERNAIYNAARAGIRTDGCTAYMSALPAEKRGGGVCTDCARAIIQAGLIRIVTYQPRGVAVDDPEWRHNLGHSFTMLREAGVQLTYVNG
jgi:dCMP deaminase